MDNRSRTVAAALLLVLLSAGFLMTTDSQTDADGVSVNDGVYGYHAYPETGTATVYGFLGLKEDLKVVDLPQETVLKVNGESATYRVTDVAPEAFAMALNIERVAIPLDIQVSEGAFEDGLVFRTSDGGEPLADRMLSGMEFIRSDSGEFRPSSSFQHEGWLLSRAYGTVQGLITVGCAISEGTAELPSYIGGMSVEAVGPNTFVDTKGVDIVIPTGVTHICAEAFHSTDVLDANRICVPDSISFPYSLSVIQQDALGIIRLGADSHVVTEVNDLRGLTIEDPVVENNWEDIHTATYTAGERQPAVLNGMTYVIDDYEATLTAADLDAYGRTDVFIPDVVLGNIPVVHTGPSVFAGSDVTSIHLGNGIDNIAPGFAAGCRYLRSVEFGTGVTEIGDNAFLNTPVMTSITIADLKVIGDRAFKNSAIGNYKLASCLEELGDEAFSGCRKLFNMNVSEGCGIREIPDYAFADTVKLDSFRIPSTVEVIGCGAFMNSGLSGTLDIPGSVTNINGKSENGEPCGAFSNCTNLQSLNIQPLQVGLKIGSYAFYNCCSLKTLELPRLVTDIGDYAFYNCLLEPGNHKLVIHEYTDNVGYAAFGQCYFESIDIIGNLTTKIGTNCFIQDPAKTTLKSVSVGTINFLGSGAFSGCGALELVDFESPAYIGELAFHENVKFYTFVTSEEPLDYTDAKERLLLYDHSFLGKGDGRLFVDHSRLIVVNTDGGTVEFDPSTVKDPEHVLPGTVVTGFLKPSHDPPGMNVELNMNGDPIELQDDRQFSFVMPDEDIVLDVTWYESEEEEDSTVYYYAMAAVTIIIVSMAAILIHRMKN